MPVRANVVSVACKSLRGGVATLAIALGMSMESIEAQDSTKARLIAGTLSGIVADTLGNPISDADVVLTESRRQVRTDANGRFRFDNVKTAKYRVSARRIGYVASAHEVTVLEAGGHVEIRMIPSA